MTKGILKAILLSGLALLLWAGAAGAEPLVGSWGWRAKPWQDFLVKECGISAAVIKGEGERIPVGEFKKYRAVVISQSRPLPFTDEENAVVKEYLQNGGYLLAATLGIGCASRNGDLSWAEWTGVTKYQYGRMADAALLAEDNPFTEHLKGQSLKWFGSEPGASGLTTARIIIGKGDICKVFFNRYGKGGFIYFSPVVMQYYKEGWQQDAEAAGLLTLVRKVITGIVSGEPAIDKLAAAGKAAAPVPPPARTAVISVNGRVRETVIIAGKSSLTAARNLAALLNRATGGGVRAVADGTATGEGFKIHVGRTAYVEGLQLDFATLHPHGYFIKLADGDNLVLVGKSDTGLVSGTNYAVTDFLKRYAGYRYFMPGALGEVLLSRDVLILPSGVNIREEPDFITYNNASLHGGNGNFSRSGRVTVLATHNLSNIFSPEKYGQEHPEYYAMINGQRRVPAKGGGTWQPCVSNPDLPGIAIEWARGYFTRRPDVLGFSLGVNDGGGDCHCDACTALKKKYGNQYIAFCNEVAKRAQKEFPGKLVGFIAYGAAAPVPRNIKLESNIYVEIASGLRNDFQDFKAWKAVGAKHLGLYDYLYGVNYVVPRYYPHIMGNAWKKAAREFGLQGAWTESSMNVWLYDGPRQYVLNELAWNIDADIDALLGDYFTSFYGPAAQPVRRFFDRIEEIYGRRGDPLHPMNDWGIAQASAAHLSEYTWDDLAYLDKCLADASAVAGKGSASERVRLLGRVFDLSRSFISARLCSLDLEKTKINGSADAKRVMEIVGKGVKTLADKDALTMTAEEEKSIFVNTDLKKYRGNMKLEPIFDQAVETAFCRITDWYKKGQGWAKARDFWRDAAAAAGSPMVRQAALSQISREENPQAKVNLIDNPSFEAEGAEAEAVDSMRARYEWRALDKKLKGWSIWSFPNSETQFFWDDTAARTGKRSLAIYKNQISGSFIKYIAVKPGEKYYLSLWVRQTPEGKQGSMSIRWQNKNGWADAGPEGAAIISVPYPRGKTSEWRRLETVFSVPDKATTALILIGAPSQTEAERIWFDDIFLARIYQP